MKKLLLVFITLTTLTNVSYSSFPITENNTVLTDQNLFILVPNDEEQEEPSWMVFIYILNAIILISGFYLVLRTIWRAWGKRKWWVRKLLPLLLLISLPTFLSSLGILVSIPLLLLLGLIMLIRKLMGKTILW